MATELKITIGDAIESANNYLCYDPEEHEAYTTHIVGAGTPERVYHDRHQLIAELPETYDADGLRDAIKDHADEFEAIRRAWKGTEFDGHNLIGQWSEGVRAEEMAEALGHSIAEGLPVRWDADDWLAGNPRASVEAALECATLAEAASREMDGAGHDVILDHAELVEALRYLLTSRREDLDDEDEDDAEEIAKIDALLATPATGAADSK